MVNTGQTWFEGQGQGLSIKLGNKKEFGQLIPKLQAFNFNFCVLKLLSQCNWLE